MQAPRWGRGVDAVLITPWANALCHSPILVFADVFVPESWVCFDEVAHELDQARVVHNVQFCAVFGDPVLAAHKVFVVAYEHATDAELANQAAAIPARRKAGGKGYLAIAALTTGISKCAGLTCLLYTSDAADE